MKRIATKITRRSQRQHLPQKVPLPHPRQELSLPLPLRQHPLSLLSSSVELLALKPVSSQFLLVLSLPFWALAALLVWEFVSRPREIWTTLQWDPWIARLATLVVLLVSVSLTAS